MIVWGVLYIDINIWQLNRGFLSGLTCYSTILRNSTSAQPELAKVAEGSLARPSLSTWLPSH